MTIGIGLDLDRPAHRHATFAKRIGRVLVDAMADMRRGGFSNALLCNAYFAGVGGGKGTGV